MKARICCLIVVSVLTEIAGGVANAVDNPLASNIQRDFLEQSVQSIHYSRSPADQEILPSQGLDILELNDTDESSRLTTVVAHQMEPAEAIAKAIIDNSIIEDQSLAVEQVISGLASIPQAPEKSFSSEGASAEEIVATPAEISLLGDTTATDTADLEAVNTDATRNVDLVSFPPAGNESSNPALPQPAIAQDSPAPLEANPAALVETSLTEFTVFPVGIILNGRTVVRSTLVRGLEDGGQPLEFDRWLIPFGDVVQALEFNVTPLDDGQVELRSRGLAIRINPNELPRDPELGTVISVRDIQAKFGVDVGFDEDEYALLFNPPWLTGPTVNFLGRRSPTVVTEGLPYIPSQDATFTFAGQRIDISGESGSNPSYQGDLTALGTLLDGSWFVQINQSDLTNLSTWTLGEAQYLLQTDPADYALGSQPTFWRSQGTGGYWGFTTIQRWGYEPFINVGSGGFSPATRLQADIAGRDIVGEAPPGSLVQLVLNSRTQVVAEVLVDSSGVYRFENVPQGGFYEVLVFPGGQLTATPEVRDATFSTLPTQLPAGTSALVASAGLRRASGGGFLGNFNDVSGGLSFRRGISQELTLGTGVIYDGGVLGLGELFYQPDTFPIRLSVSALVGGDDGLDLNAGLTYEPSSDFRVDLSTDKFSSRFLVGWQPVPNLTLRATGNTREEAFGFGLTSYVTSPNFFATASADYFTNGNFRWSGIARYDRFELSTRGNEISSDSELLSNLGSDRSFSYGHFLRLGYSTRSTGTGTSDLLSAGWRYRSQPRAVDGRYLWEVDAGYGFGSQGSGVLLSASTATIPGLVLRARYEGISALSGTQSFRIELQPFVNTQVRALPQDSRFDYMREQGGLWLQPFLDKNGNGRLDADEHIFVEDAQLLFAVNGDPIRRLQPEILSNGILLRTFPGVHRVDLDPAGYPVDWTPRQSAYAVEVVAGSYTPVLVPFTLSYTVAGRVLNAAGQPVAGVTVEAVPVSGGIATTSVTNGAGVYYLESLQQGTYTLRVSGTLALPNTITINENSESLQEINLQVP